MLLLCHYKRNSCNRDTSLEVHYQLLLSHEINPNMAAEKVLKKGSTVSIQTVSPRSGVKESL